jgi:LPXTG-site transpeptidase (sortase) family protein
VTSPGRVPPRHGAGRPTALRTALAVGAAVFALTVVGCAPAAPGTEPTASAEPSAATATPDAGIDPAPAVAPLPVGRPPASVAIPAIGLDEPLIDLGLDAAGGMEVPEDWDAVGWFTGGGRPGGIGPTVIAGHVDSATGPAVFHRLDELVEGDRFAVTDVDGTVFDYEVYRVEDVVKADFPTAEVFGAMPTDEVRLITCGGVFDTAARSYEDNRVVFARPI